MIKIDEKVADLLSEFQGIGHFSEFGAVVGNSEFVIYYADDSNIPYLAHISEFEQQGLLIRLKDKNETN